MEGVVEFVPNNINMSHHPFIRSVVFILHKYLQGALRDIPVTKILFTAHKYMLHRYPIVKQ